jgi:hypothetical protein
MLVGHADGVAASLSLMPSQAEHAIEKVDYGGLFLGKRRTKQEKPSKASKARKKNLVSIVPDGGLDDDTEAVLDPDTPTLLLGNRATNNNRWLDEEHPEENMGESEEQVELPEASDGWQVFTHNIDMQKKVMRSGGSLSKSFSKKVSALAANSRFSRERIDKLLGELIPATPLGVNASTEQFKEREAIAYEEDARIGTYQTVPTILSFSTFLFGASDVGNMSEFGSESASRVPTLSEACRIPSLNEVESIADHGFSPRTAFYPSRGSNTSRSQQRLTSRGSNASLDDDSPSPTLLVGSSRFTNVPYSINPMALEKVLGSVADKHPTSPRTEEQSRHRIPSLVSRTFGSGVGEGSLLLEKVDEKAEPMVTDGRRLTTSGDGDLILL